MPIEWTYEERGRVCRVRKFLFCTHNKKYPSPLNPLLILLGCVVKWMKKEAPHSTAHTTQKEESYNVDITYTQMISNWLLMMFWLCSNWPMKGSQFFAIQFTWLKDAACLHVFWHTLWPTKWKDWKSLSSLLSFNVVVANEVDFICFEAKKGKERVKTFTSMANFISSIISIPFYFIFSLLQLFVVNLKKKREKTSAYNTQHWKSTRKRCWMLKVH